jgi:hypothetical protein
VSWPPSIGEPLPNADLSLGIREKLAAYCLNLDHEIGGPKAEGFRRILGIELADLDYLAEALSAGARSAPSWELRHAGDAPRLVTAYIDG